MSATPDTVLTNLRNLLTCLGCGVKLFDSLHPSYRSLPLSSISCLNQRCALCCVRSVHSCSIHNPDQSINPALHQSNNQSNNQIVARVDGVFEHGLLISCLTERNVMLKGMLLFDESMIEIRTLNANLGMGEAGSVDPTNNQSIKQSIHIAKNQHMAHIPLFPDALINQSFDMIHQPHLTGLTTMAPSSHSNNQSSGTSTKRKYTKTGAYRGKRKAEFLAQIGQPGSQQPGTQ